MAKSAEDQPKSAQESPLIADAWLNGFGLNPFAAVGGKACSEWLQECTRFATERLQKAHEAGTKLVACENVYDLSRLQQEWVQEAFADYVAESNRIVELALATSIDVFRPSVVNRKPTG